MATIQQDDDVYVVIVIFPSSKNWIGNNRNGYLIETIRAHGLV